MKRSDKIKFEPNGFGGRLKSMLTVDFRRMFTMPLLHFPHYRLPAHTLESSLPLLLNDLRLLV